MRVVVLRTYLEMRSPGEARLANPEIPGLEVRPVEPSDVVDYRETFEDVGRDVLWVRRLGWQDVAYQRRLERSDVRAWLVWLEGVSAGLLELELKRDGSVEIAHIGVRSRFQGRGLGKHLLSFAIERAFELGATRFWLFTLSIDGEHALENYLKRGFKIWKRRAAIVTVPDSLAPKVRERVESARARGVHPGFLRHVEAYLRDSPPGAAAMRIVYELKRGAGALRRRLGA
jgi:ribosomal protein S18 acetylase RimI-like enzyme